MKHTILFLVISCFITIKNDAQEVFYKHSLVDELAENIAKIHPKYIQSKIFSKEKIDSVEQQIGVQLPLSLKAFYQKEIWNCSGLGYGWFFNSPNELPYRYKPYWISYTDFPERVNLDADFNKLIPIITDAGGSNIFLDFDPNPKGKKGQLILVFRDYPEITFLIADDFDDFLKILNDALKYKKVKMEEDYMQFKSGGYSDFVSLNNRFKAPKKDNPELVRLSPIWEKPIMYDNGEFTNKKTNELTYNDLDRIYYANLYDENIRHIDTLALFSNLAKVSLYLKEEKISDALIDILSKTKVMTLEITMEKEIDISSLIKLKKHLRNLSISAPNVLNYEKINEFSNLKWLDISASDITDLRFLEKMPQLKVLNLGNFYRMAKSKNYTNYHSLEKIIALERLDFTNCNFSKMEILTKLPRLNELAVSNCPIIDYENFEKIKNPLQIACDGLFLEKTLDYVKKSKLKHRYGVFGGLSESQQKLYDDWRKSNEMKK